MSSFDEEIGIVVVEERNDGRLQITFSDDSSCALSIEEVLTVGVSHQTSKTWE